MRNYFVALLLTGKFVLLLNGYWSPASYAVLSSNSFSCLNVALLYYIFSLISQTKAGVLVLPHNVFLLYQRIFG